MEVGAVLLRTVVFLDLIYCNTLLGSNGRVSGCSRGDLVHCATGRFQYQSCLEVIINEYRRPAEKVPAALSEIGVQLPLLVSDLKRVKKQAEGDELDNDFKQAVLAIVQGCQNHVEVCRLSLITWLHFRTKHGRADFRHPQALNDILATISPQPGDSTWKRGQKVLLSIAKYDGKIKEISEKLRNHVIYLTHHLVVDVAHARSVESHVVTGGTPLISTAPPRVKPSMMIPFKRDAKHFVGRTELMDSLEHGFEDLNRLALVGLGGVGKSQIAIEYAYRLAELDPDLWVFWVHVNSRSRFKQSYADIARKVQLPKIEHPEHDALQEVTDWLNDESHGRWLLVLDNCDDLDVIKNIEQGLTGSSAFGGIEEKPLIDYVPNATHGKILATCRSRNVAMEMTCSEPEALIPVSEMSADEALSLLRSKLPKDKSSDVDHLALAEELGCIPLALKQAAAYISLGRGHMTMLKYLQLFRESEASQTKLLMKDFNDATRDRELKNSIILTWEISFDQIRTSNPAAADLLALMSSFDRQVIPRCLLCEEDDDVDFEDQISLLMNYSLVIENSDEDNYNMHRLVQLTTQSWLVTEKQQMHWWEEALTTLTKVFPEDDYDNWRLCQTLLPHAQLVAGRNFTSSSSVELLSDLFRKVGIYDMGQGRYEAAHQRLTSSHEIRRRVFGEQHRLTLESLNALGGVLEREGHWQQAETTHRKTFEIRQQLYGKSDVQTLEAENSLSLDLIDEGKYVEAEALLRQALESEESLNEENPVRLTSMTHLGLVAEKQGHFAEAVDTYRSMLKVQDRCYSQEHPATLETLNHLGRTLSELGLLTEAATILTRAYQSKSEVLGPEHPKTLNALSALIGNQERQGKLKEAIALLRKLVDLQDRVSYPEVYEISTLMNFRSSDTITLQPWRP